MTTTSNVSLTPTHLSPRPVDAILVAWLNNDDVQAIRRGDTESLWINGRPVALDPEVHLCPVQLVVNLAAATLHRRKEMIDDLLSLTQA